MSVDTDIERRIIVAPGDRERVALVRYPIPAGGEWEIPVDAEFLGWTDDIDPLEVAVWDADGRLFLVEGAGE